MNSAFALAPSSLRRRDLLRGALLSALGATFRAANAVSGLLEVQPARSSPSRPQIDGLMLAYMERFRVPGASLAFLRGAEVLYASGYGLADRTRGVPVTPATRFRIASNSKAFTAVGIFLLLEANQLQLTSPVFGKQGLLPEYATIGAPHRDWLESLSVHHLLTHTGGGWGIQHSDPMFQMPGLGQHELIAWTLRTHPLEFPPGTHCAYSNFGYCVLGRVLETLGKAPYPVFTSKKVLQPAGITDMQIGTDRTAPEEALYYAVPGGGDPYSLPITRMDANGGWIATALDQARFLAALFAPKDVPGPAGLLRPDSVRLMTTPTTANPGYACGLLVNTAGHAWHFGSLPGSISLMLHTHGGLSWAAVLNTRGQGQEMELALDRLMWSMAHTEPAWKA